MRMSYGAPTSAKVCSVMPPSSSTMAPLLILKPSTSGSPTGLCCRPTWWCPGSERCPPPTGSPGPGCPWTMASPAARTCSPESPACTPPGTWHVGTTRCSTGSCGWSTGRARSSRGRSRCARPLQRQALLHRAVLLVGLVRLANPVRRNPGRGRDPWDRRRPGRGPLRRSLSRRRPPGRSSDDERSGPDHEVPRAYCHAQPVPPCCLSAKPLAAQACVVPLVPDACGAHGSITFACGRRMCVHLYQPAAVLLLDRCDQPG